jgi:hypothetical protein
MCLDEILTRKIWSPIDFKQQERALDYLGMGRDQDFKDAVLDANKQKGKILQKELSKKSVIGLFVIAFLLVFCGYEQEIYDPENIAPLKLLYLELAYTCVIFIVSLFLLQYKLFEKVKYVTLYIIGLFFTFLIIRWKALVYNESGVEQFVVDNIGLFICIIVTIPIIWQIIIIWIYKSVFYGYVKTQIRNAQAEYARVLDLLNKHQFDQLPKQYHEIYIRITQASSNTTPQQALGDSLMEYQGALYNEIRSIGLKIRLSKLMVSWVVFKTKKCLWWLKELFTSRGKSLMKSKRLVEKNYEDYAKKYKNMKLQNKSLKMKQFCEIVSINFDEFERYYRKYCQNY